MSIALIYVRQSRNKAGDHTVSPEVQEAGCRALPAVAACTQIEIYRDLDVSGGKKGRKQYEAMMERIRAGGASVVAAYDQSRAFRSSEFAIMFKALLTEPANAAIQVVFVHGTFDRTPVGGFSYTVLAAAHQMEKDMAAVKIREAYRSLNAKGIPTGPATYGYAYLGKTRTSGVLQLDPEQAPVVRRIFDMYAEGSSPKAIAQTLRDEGISASSKRGWLPDTIVGMLGNISYTARSYSESRREKAGEIIQATWPALIDDGLFQRVQDRMTRLTPAPSRFARAKEGTRKAPKRKQLPKSATAFTFRGLLWCTECDRRFVSQRDHNHARYFCGSRETTEPCEAGKNSIREELLLPWVDDLIAGFELGRMGGLRFGKRPLIAKETAAEAIQNLDSRLARLDTRFSLGSIDEPTFRSELEALRRTRANYAAQLVDAPKPEELEGIAALWKSGDARIRSELLTALFEKLHVTNREIIGYTPRSDRVGRVAMLLSTAMSHLDGARNPLPATLYTDDDGPGAARVGDVQRSGRDLNPRGPCGPTAFPVPRPRPS